MIYVSKRMKAFNKRNILKQSIHKKKRHIYIKEREVWFANLWINIWYEQDWNWDTFERPVLVIKRVWNVYFILPLTTWWKDSKWYHLLSHHYFNKTSRIILSQPRVIDKNRFIRKLATVDEWEFLLIKKKLRDTLL